MKTQHDHHDRLSVRLSVIISRLLAGESLELKVLADEFGVSERTLQLKWSTKTGHRVRVFSSIDFPIRLVVT
ncbi:hypothetical protein RNP91_19175, partial [Escherichia coli]|nr:hypothetical protein [Escherichia coli]